MNIIEKIKRWFSGKKTVKEPEIQPQASERISKKCKKCGKIFTVNPSWEHIPNYCKDCKQQFVKEKEDRIRAGKPRQIKRTCKQCGKNFTFPSTLPHYPNYCSNCRKAHQAAMKEKYGRAAQKKNS